MTSISSTAASQELSFHYLGASQGLHSLASWNMAIDQYGFYWVATSDGIIRYNGKEVSYYDENSHPGIPSRQISYVYADSKNRIWLCHDSGLVSLDETRKPYQHQLIPGIDSVNTDACFESGDGVMYVLTTSGVFAQEGPDGSWEPQPWLDSLMAGNNFRDPRQFDRDRFMIVLPRSGVLIFNTRTKSKSYFIPHKNANCATRIGTNSIVVSTAGSFSLTKYDLNHPQDPIVLDPPAFVEKNNVHQQINYMVRGMDHKLYMTTVGAGLLCLDSTLTHYTHYRHDPVDPGTIINNSLRYILADSSGNLLVSSLDGLNYTNVFHTAVRYVNYLKTDDGRIFDERVISVADGGNNKIWVCIRDNVLIYDRLTGTAQLLQFPEGSLTHSSVPSPVYLQKDRSGNMWVAVRNEGLLIFNSDGTFKKGLLANNLPHLKNLISKPRVLTQGYDEYMYVGNESGIYRVSNEDFSIDTFPDHPELVPLKQERIVDILTVPDGFWISSSPRGAAWYYSFKDKILKKYDQENGLNSNRVYSLANDQHGNVFAGSYSALSIIRPDESIANLVKGQGLISLRIESVETDNAGNVWMTNNYNLLRYDPSTGNVTRFAGRHGIMDLNFAIMASCRMDDGMLAFGVHKGFILFDPNQLGKTVVDPLKLYVFQLHDDGSETRLVPGQKVSYDYKHRNVRLAFAVNDMTIANQVMYRYRLAAGPSVTWTAPSYDASVDFNLDPGERDFELEVYDGQQWISLGEAIQIRIIPPWWRQWWFHASLILVIVLAGWLYFRSRINKYRNEASIARQIYELESRALRAQMNPHFVFNSLNAIQECIVTGRVDEAYAYLSKFSRLLRMVLELSDAGEVRLQDELEVLSLYVTLEKLRFKNDMSFQLDIDPDLDPDEIWITPMLIQPHVENAIWHGLRHLQGDKELLLSFREVEVDYLEIIIEDNGIGRERSGQLSQNRLRSKRHASRGMLLSSDRMMILQKVYPATSITIEDVHPGWEVPGTRVKLMIPMIKKAQPVIR